MCAQMCAEFGAVCSETCVDDDDYDDDDGAKRARAYDVVSSS